MIFISHTHNDKSLVEPIAEKLSTVFGQDQVFYDSWAIQPGDGIIEKMNEALSKCTHFFFFVSKNSIQSEMVKLEWQNALYKKTKSNIKIIPVKMDDCMMPDILLQTLYIDFFGQGPDNALRQMIDVINGVNTYKPNQMFGFQNIRAYIEYKNNGEIEIEMRAEVYMEPHSNYLILVKNDKSDLKWAAIGESAYLSGYNKEIILTDGQKFSAVSIGRNTPTSPGFPFITKLTPKTGTKINLVGVMRAISRQQYAFVPTFKK